MHSPLSELAGLTTLSSTLSVNPTGRSCCRAGCAVGAPAGAAARLTAGARPAAYVVNRGERAASVALRLARDLRRADLAIELDDSGAAFGKQFKRADRCGAPWALILGDDEIDQRLVRLKRLQGEPQEQSVALTAISAIVDTLRSS